MPIHFRPKQRHTMEVILLEPGQVAPEGADWIEIGPCMGNGWVLDGSVDVPLGSADSHPHWVHARDEALGIGMAAGVALLYVETDARRCD